MMLSSHFLMMIFFLYFVLYIAIADVPVINEIINGNCYSIGVETKLIGVNNNIIFSLYSCLPASSITIIGNSFTAATVGAITTTNNICNINVINDTTIICT